MTFYLRRFFVLLVLYCGISSDLQAQDRKKLVDSLKIQFHKVTTDSSRVEILNAIAWNISYENLDSGLFYANQAEALGLAKHVNDVLLGDVYNTKAAIYQDMGVLNAASNYYHKALKVTEPSGNSHSLATIYGNMSNLENRRGNYKKMRLYLFKALRLFEQVKSDIGVVSVCSNLASSYREHDMLDSALYYSSIALNIARQKKMHDRLGMIHAVIGSTYGKMGDSYKAIQHFDTAVSMLKIGGYDYELSQVYQIRAQFFLDKNNWNGALPDLNESIVLAEKIGIREILYHLYEKRALAFEMKGDFQKALEDYKIYTELFLKLREESAIKSMDSMNIAMETERRNAEISKLRDANAIKDLDAKRQDDQIRIQNLVLGIGGISLILVISLSFVLYKGNKQKQKTNLQLTHQKEIIEEKNKEIVDSINYARRLQDAILPPKRFMQELLPEHFVLYLPKDIVAGDFFYAERVPGNPHQVLIAVADCTGHGVPGAMVSVVCQNAIQRVVKEFGITETGKILDKVRELVVETFAKSEDEVKDGMDISLCKIDFSTRQLQWSGANNPLWIFGEELLEISPDKQAIGLTNTPKPFTTHDLQLHKGDLLLLFSDGYADQFGGEKAKKLKSANFRNQVESLAQQPVVLIKENLKSHFLNWKGDLEQVDDVCVIGVRL
jgi:serine phosphatase RsbU (regulator of sigma subunit)